jgi:hypothetical protein
MTALRLPPVLTQKDTRLDSPAHNIIRVQEGEKAMGTDVKALHSCSSPVGGIFPSFPEKMQQQPVVVREALVGKEDDSDEKD